MRLQGVRPTLLTKQSLPTTPKDRKKRGISLSSQKMKCKQERKENLEYFVKQKTVDGEIKVRLDKFIIYNMDRKQWQTSKREDSKSKVRRNSQHVIEPSTMEIQSGFKTIKQFTNSVEFPRTAEFVLPNLPVMEMIQQEKPKGRGRTREIRSRISEIQQRLNSLLQATKIY